MDNVALVATDLDRTLLLEGGHTPPGLWDYVRRLNDRGITFVPASGRPLVNLRRLFAKPGYDVALISDNGAVVEVKGQVIYRSVMEPERYLPIVDLTLSETHGMPLLCGTTRAYVSSKAKSYVDAVGAFFDNLVITDDFSSVEEEVVKVSAFYVNEDARDSFDRHFVPSFGDQFSVTLGGAPWVDVMNRGVTKGSAMEILAQHLDLEAAQLMAFGDGLNDVEMLETVGHGYAVANALPEVLARARYVAPSNDDLGVLRTLDELLERR